MTERFFFWETNPFNGVRSKTTWESWPFTTAEACDEVSELARDWAMKWREDEFFPTHPFRDRAGNVLMPDSLDMSPETYVDAHEPAAPAPEPVVRYPFSGPANIHRGPATSSATIAAYEASRRGFQKIEARPPPPAYEAPTPRVKGFTPNTPPQPKIPPRIYQADSSHPKYQKPGSR